MHIKTEQVERHTLAVIVDNEPGILARIAGLFTARGYNIESLTVSEITADKAVSRITIVTSASPPVMEQIIAQLDRLVPVHKVTDLTVLGDHVERELALVKVAGTGDRRIDKFVELMGEVGLVEVARTGIAAISRGKDAA